MSEGEFRHSLFAVGKHAPQAGRWSRNLPAGLHRQSQARRSVPAPQLPASWSLPAQPRQ